LDPDVAKLARKGAAAGISNETRIMSELRRDYKIKGYVIKALHNTESVGRLNALCHDIHRGRVKHGYKAETKFSEAGCEVVLDHKYDPILLDILFENGVPEVMREVAGPSATLCYINAVTSLPPGYMTDWHSDGHARMVHKLLYYPTLGGRVDPCLEIIPGHIKPHWFSRSRILSNRYSAWLESTIFAKQRVDSSNEAFVLLNTWTTHRAFPVRNPTGVFRLIYSFIEWFEDEQERRHISELPGTPIRINEQLVEHYRRRLSQARTSG